jgi:hypothetical protein
VVRLVRKVSLIFAVLVCATPSIWSQTLTVLNESTGFSNFNFRDTSVEVRVVVRLSSADTLTNIVPTLNPPACAQYQGAPLLATSYMGYLNGASVVQGALPSLAQNNNATFVFNIHYFAGDETICDTTFPCPNDLFSFDLSYTHSGSTAPIAANQSSGLLEFGGAIDGGFSIVQEVGTSTRNSQSCTRVNGEIIPPFQFLGLDVTVVNDPASRVLIGVDWDAHLETLPQGFLEALDVFDIPVGPSRIVDLYNLVTQEGVTMLDPTEPIIDINTNFSYNLATQLGGDGEVLGPTDPNCGLQFWNFFDVTDKDLKNAPGVKIKNSLGIWSNEFLSLDRGSQIIHHRETAVFLAYPNDCSVRDGLGSSLRDFEINSLVFNDDQTVDVDLTVPDAWLGTNNNLLNGYTLSWFYRNNETFSPASIVTGTNQMTSVTLSVPFSEPGEFSIEARVTRTVANDTDPVVSVVSDAHDLAYLQTALLSFENAEVNDTGGPAADDYLDPGEIMTFPIQITNNGDETLSNISLTLGSPTAGIELSMSAAPAAEGITAGDFSLAPGQSTEFDISLFLISSDLECQEIEYFYDVAYTNSAGFQTSYRESFVIFVNCEEVETFYSLSSTWTPQECFGDPVCTDSNCNGSTIFSSATADWTYNVAGNSWTGTSLLTTKYLELLSPVFPVGLNSRIEMNHLPSFLFRLAGGIVEYRNCSSAGNCESSDWQDLVLELESVTGQSYYNASIFPALDSFQDNIIGDRRVFHDISTTQNIEATLSNTVFNSNFVQFRFVFQNRTLNGGNAPGTWTINNFDYISLQPLEDNLFDLPTVSLAPCPEPFTFVPGISGNYQFAFYTSIEDLVDGSPPDTINTTGIWDYPIPLSSTTYYAVVTDLDTGVQRIWPMQANNEQTVPPFGTCTSQWNTVDGLDCDLNSDNTTNMLDLVRQRNDDECVLR